jgi:hypothetical protein
VLDTVGGVGAAAGGEEVALTLPFFGGLSALVDLRMEGGERVEELVYGVSRRLALPDQQIHHAWVFGHASLLLGGLVPVTLVDGAACGVGILGPP